MTCNVGKVDKTARIIVGILIGATGFYFRSWWGLAALVPLITVFTGICPLYKLLGINTCKSKTSIDYNQGNIE